MSKKVTKKSKMRKATKHLRKFDKEMKMYSNEMHQDFKVYKDMIEDFDKNLDIFKYICAVSVAAQNDKRKDKDSLTPELNAEVITRISELHNFHTVYLNTKEQVQSLRNHLSLAKKIRGNYEQLLLFITNQFVPLISEVQANIINLYDLFRQYIPKNKEALARLSDTNPYVKQVLAAIEEFENKNFPTKEESEVVTPENNSEVVTDLELVEPVETSKV